MNILLVSTGLGIGGAERQVCELADQFASLGHKVILVSMTGDIIVTPNSELVSIISLGMGKSIFSVIRSYIKMTSIIRAFRPDVVHSHMVHANLFCRALRITTRIPKLICSAHSCNEGTTKWMFAYRISDFLCDISTNVSQDSVNAYIAKRAAPTKKIITMYNGIDTDKFHFDHIARRELRCSLEIKEYTPLLLAVGRLTEAKDFSNLLTAFSFLDTDASLPQLVIIGDGHLKPVLEAQAYELGIMGRVHFLGRRHDINKWMSAADVFVLSSAWEGFGLVVAEAMSCERVVVATDCGGVREVVGECCFLVTPKDSFLLANQLNKTINLSDDEVRSIGILARTRVVEKFSLAVQARRWLKLYSSN